MVRLLRAIADRTPGENPYIGDFRARELRQDYASLAADVAPLERWILLDKLGLAEFYAGHFAAALERQQELYDLTSQVADQLTDAQIHSALFNLGMTHMRIGETTNCALQHTPDSCILPIRGGGIHTDPFGSRQAIRFFTELLQKPRLGPDLGMQTRWLLNLAFMTVDEYPGGVPPELLIPPEVFASEVEFPAFEDIAAHLGLDTFGMSGGVIIDDFDNDLDLDLLVSDWHPSAQIRLWRNNADGTFTEVTESAGLTGLFGGLNMVQADYDNDGDVDAYVLRGAWLGRAGQHPNSLLRNDGDLTFTDVTFEARLGGERYPTQTAAWADYDNDGDVDLFVATESTPDMLSSSLLYRNNGDGTFDEIGRQAGVENRRYCKGAAWGDFDGDRWPDIYVSNISGNNRLYHNNRDGTFTDVAEKQGVEKPWNSFPTWFWDFDNDGSLDLFVNSYPRSMAQTALSYLGEPVDAELARLYRGDGRGGFIDVSGEVGFTKAQDPMGANFGDLNGDGYLDFYLGTGFPPFHAISPNALYLNLGGDRFADVTTASRLGHLQKGHGIAFADLDHDGDEEVFAVMGGAVPGDEYHNALWENPGFGSRWLTVKLIGVRSNRSAIGARVAVTIRENETQRTVFRYVNSGGSFGANPLRQTIGLGRADRIEAVEIYWPTSDTS
ncbi:MAG: CRTAC1 family protein, partial [Thermoanaerobaculia bacterium]